MNKPLLYSPLSNMFRSGGLNYLPNNHPLMPFAPLLLGDTSAQASAQPRAATTSTSNRLPPPTFVQQDRESVSPRKVTKSHDHHHRIFSEIRSSSSTLSSAVSHGKHIFNHLLFPMDVAIRCTTPDCSCDCFAPGKTQLRICATCGHPWISHAMDKLSFRHLYNSHGIVENNIQSNAAFDIASLALYGTHALPVRLKILLDRVLCTLNHDELLHLLHGFGWTYEDYSRGYMLQDSSGNVLSRWSIVTKDEESLIVQQFLRFGETKSIAQNFLLQDVVPIEQINSSSAISLSAKRDSDIRKFIERTNKSSITSSLNVKHATNSKHYSINNTGIHSTNQLSIPINSSYAKMMDQKSILTSSPCDRAKESPPTDSPLTLSPLNKLQNMQPFDFRRTESMSSLPPSDIPISLVQCTTPSSSPTTTSSTSLLQSGHVLTTTAPSMNHVSSISTNMTTSTNSDLSGTDGDSDNDTNMSGAINLSQTSSAYALKKVKHLRKSANPMKRRWNPMVLSGLTTNPSTGKKRVQCHVCLKTFCDKGALKIHFSAVHLREMHKCTVDGCNMMFSSRRSRNRHSANPNPKLHTPNFRRKVNPHDGRSALPFPLLPSSTSSTMLNLTGNNLMGQSINSMGMMDGDQINVEYGNLASSSSSSKTGLHHENERDIPTSGSSCSPSIGQYPEEEIMSALPLTNKTNKCQNDSDNKDVVNFKNGSFGEGINLSLKDEQLTNKNVRKRKSMNPIKCAPMVMSAMSDDEMRYISSDDSSSDTYIDRIDDDNGLMDDSKSEDDFSSEGICCPDDSKDEMHDGVSKEKNRKIEESHKKVVIEYDNDGTIDLSKKRSSPERKIQIKSENLFNAKTIATESVLENPLRHLESLSLGAFTSLVPQRNQRGGIFASSSSHPLSFHAPGLGMCMKPPPPSPPTSITPQPEKNEKESSSLSKDSDTGKGNMMGNAVPSGLDIDSNDQVSLLPVFRDSPFIGHVDVPVDKENPRRCVACGKIFQNHFGVKTHYQNVHLKLMHKCTVEGCNASFPSKRSRDRHSSNLNLHRKLLSTHGDSKPSFGLDKSSSNLFPYPPGATLRDDIFSRLYDPQGLPLSLGELYSRLPPLGPDGLFAASAAAAAAAASFPVVPGFHHGLCIPPLPPPPPVTSAGALYFENRSTIGRDTPSSIGTTPSPSPSNRSSPHKIRQSNSPFHPFVSIVLDNVITPNDDGNYICIFCQKFFAASMTLKEHYEMVHSDVLYKCCVRGCNKAFLTKKSKKRHTQLHSPHHERSP